MEGLENSYKKSELGFLFLLERLPYQSEKAKPAFLFIRFWKKSCRIRSFPKSISTMWNAYYLFQDLDSRNIVPWR